MVLRKVVKKVASREQQKVVLLVDCWVDLRVAY